MSWLSRHRSASGGRRRGFLGSCKPWALLGALLLALSWSAPMLVPRLIIAPAAQGQRAGWMAEWFDNERLVRPPRRTALAPPGDFLTLDRPQNSMSAYGLWRAPRDGVYRFLLVCDDYGALGLDGRMFHAQEDEVAAYNVSEAALEVKAGPHLLRLDLHNAKGRGFALLLAAAPGELDYEVLPGAQVAAPALGNVRNWWRFLELTPWLGLAGAACLATAALIILLPRTLGTGPAALALACLVAVAPALLIPGPPPRKLPFDDRGVIERLRAEQPRYVFIGNSIVESHIDPAGLGRLLGGARVSTVITHGGMTAYDYLMFKNFVVASGIKPKQVFFTFRGASLTDPWLRTEGEFRQTIETMSHAREEVLDAVLAGRRGWDERLAAGLRRDLFPVTGWRNEVRSWVDQAALFLAIPPLPGNKPEKWRPRLKEAVNQRFALDRLRGGAGDMVEQSGRELDFDAQVEGSFLPPIIELAHRHGVGLVFLRAPERPGPQGPVPDDPRLKRYLERARAYLAQRGIPFHDFTGDPEITLEMYASGDHIADPARYSEILHRRLAGVFQ